MYRYTYYIRCSLFFARTPRPLCSNFTFKFERARHTNKADSLIELLRNLSDCSPDDTFQDPSLILD